MKLSFIFLVFTILLSGCATVYNPAIGVEEVAFVDTATEVSMGQRMAAEIRRELPVSRDSALNQRLKKIGTDIARVSDRQDLQYHFYVIRDKQINAFTIPGGFVYVYSGLMETVDDDELAIVLAHEVGHVAARHPAKKMEINMGYDLLNSLIFGRSNARDMQRVMNIFFNIVASGYERQDEFMADRLSVRYALRAGYNPEAAIRFMKKLQEYHNRQGAPAYTLLSSHPPLEDRIKNIEVELGKFNSEGDKEVSPLPEEPKPAPQTKSDKPVRRYSNMKVCPKCGRTYPLSFKYCTRDGSKLE